MEQPTDRLGQPLKVGDMVIFNSIIDPLEERNGRKLEICGFREGLFRHKGKETPEVAMSIIGDDQLYYAIKAVTKINPKQEVTTWDECVWQPEGVGV